MHYKAHLITREFPTNDVIDKIMQPFSWEEYHNRKNENENEPYPVFTWDWYQVGGRYNSFFDLDMDKQKTAYEIQIRDWSSDVCSSDLRRNHGIPSPPASRRPRSSGRSPGR